MLSGTDLCDELIIHPEESYRLWRVVMCDLNFVNEEALAQWGVVVPNKKNWPKCEASDFYSKEIRFTFDPEHRLFIIGDLFFFCFTQVLWSSVGRFRL